MRLTRKKAIALCIELWTWLAETGGKKQGWPEWEKYGRGICNYCWFCEYGIQQEARYRTDKEDCDYCPLSTLYKKNGCYDEKCGYCQWENATTFDTRKKYAKLFLGQIKSIEQRN